MARKYDYVVEMHGEKGWEIVYEGNNGTHARLMVHDWAGDGKTMRYTMTPAGSRKPKQPDHFPRLAESKNAVTG